MLKEYTFREIEECFDPEVWRIGYLTENQVNTVYNVPVRREYINFAEPGECFIPNPDKLVFIFVQSTVDFDYGQFDKISKILSAARPDLEFEPRYNLNLKLSMVLSGLGQYGKNSLIYDDKFGFDIHTAAVAIKNPISDLPPQAPPRFRYLPQCEGCTDCFNACPVHAIHNQDEGIHWIDAPVCDTFCHYGNHPVIPSLKWSQLALEYPWLTKDEIYDMDSRMTYEEVLSKQISAITIIKGKPEFISLPVCRECVSQPKCSKYNGKYPYQASIDRINHTYNVHVELPKE